MERETARLRFQLGLLDPLVEAGDPLVLQESLQHEQEPRDGRGNRRGLGLRQPTAGAADFPAQQ